MSTSWRWLVRLYPPDWRSRYEDEYLAMLEECSSSPRVLLDVAAGALDARLNAPVLLGGLLSMTSRLRSSQITIFCAFILFVLSGMGFQKMSEDFVHVQKVYPAIGTPFKLVVAGAVIALLAVLAGGLPIAFAALRFALRHRRWDVILLLLVPPAALAVWIGYIAVVMRLLPPAAKATAVQVSQMHIWAISVVGLFILAAIASTAAVSLAISRADVGEGLYRFALLPSAVAVGAMAMVLVAIIAWGLGVQADAPQLYNGNDGFLATSTVASWIFHIVTIGLAVLIGLAGLVRGFGGGRGRARMAPAA